MTAARDPRLALDDIDRLTGGGLGEFRTVCPVCASTRRTPAKARLRVLKIWRRNPDFASYACAHCGIGGYARAPGAPRAREPARRAAQEKRAIDVRRRREEAAFLWRISRPARASPVEAYLRSRGIAYLPSTVRYLMPRRQTHHPAMIVPYGLPAEPEPGVLAMAETAIAAVHLTFLTADGRKAAMLGGASAKITRGSPLGLPLVLAPMNDLLGLAIAEGIEDAMSVHQATGLGAWAAGCASYLPSLADRVPDCADCVSLMADDDADGRRHCDALARRLMGRGIHVELYEAPRRR